MRKKPVTPTAGSVSSNLALPALQPLQEDVRPGTAPSNLLPQLPSIHLSAQAAAASQTATPENVDDETGSNSDSAIGNTIPRNPSDAWQLLRDVATKESDQAQGHHGSNHATGDDNLGINQGQEGARRSLSTSHGIQTYRLVREHYLTPDVIHNLVRHYADHYHAYLPLVPKNYLEPAALDTFAVEDKHLLTAVLTIASKDWVEQPQIHQAVSRYMHDLISGIAAGHDCEVEAVEALLLLAEWEPQGLRNRIEAIGRGEEDRSAWMHVGIALRTGYWLALDRTAFRQESAEEAKVDARKRLAWANCYVSDRLISVRIGRAFWSRGPGPMTGLSSRDFPTLQPTNPGDEDYAKIFQATLDLTQLYSNVHDVLYSGMRTSGQMMLMGDYVKYVDGFRQSLTRWHERWSGLQCSKHIKITLQMSYEYLCLYTNAFVFQATISQAVANKPKGDAHTLRNHLRSIFGNIGSMPDARFIWSSVTAAKSFLTLLTQIDPVKYLRYMPLRYYLYSIYSAVFLYKARSFGVLDQIEERQVRQTIYQSMEILKRASLSPQDPGSRYARLLELLWMKPPKVGQTFQSQTVQSPAPSDSQMSNTGSIKLDASGYIQYSPANDFSWLDLEAVGDYVSNDPMAAGNNNILAPMVGYQAPAGFVAQADGMQWQTPNAMLGNMQYDIQGNLFF